MRCSLIVRLSLDNQILAKDIGVESENVCLKLKNYSKKKHTKQKATEEPFHVCEREIRFTMGACFSVVDVDLIISIWNVRNEHISAFQFQCENDLSTELNICQSSDELCTAYTSVICQTKNIYS